MIPESIRKLPNPYFPIIHRLDPKQFIGRETALEKLNAALEEYRKTYKLKNLVVTGEKSIGKSTLLHRYKQILEDYNFIVYETELPRDTSVEINAFEFFKDLINELFLKYTEEDCNFFDTFQSQIWFSLTSGAYEDPSSSFLDRKLAFATQYSNYKKGINEKISAKTMLNDFNIILQQIKSPGMESAGLAILIDEFQELARNVLILDIMRQLSEQINGLIIIGAGLPTFLDNAIFEKFIRTSETITLSRMSIKERFDLVFNPLESYGKYTRWEISEWFDWYSLLQVIMRSGGNPLHINVLCSKMFEHLQQNLSQQEIELNRDVMEDVMTFYSNISEKSKNIRLALESSSKDQLESFSMLYRYEGFSIRAAIMFLLAFESITPEREEREKIKLIQAMRDIWDLGLFELNDKSITLEALEGMSPSKLSNITYNFVGDTIDKLYVLYFYEALTGKNLISNDGKSFETILAEIFASELYKLFFELKIPRDIVLPSKSLLKVNSELGDDCENINDFINDLDKLKTAHDKSKPSSDSIVKSMKEISKKYNLNFPAQNAFFNQFEGYLIIVVQAKIRGKTKFILKYFPVTRHVDELPQNYKKVEGVSFDVKILEQYLVTIEGIFACWLSKETLLYIKILDKLDKDKELYQAVAKRDFDNAISLADLIYREDQKISEGRLYHNVESCNNFSFCLINIDKIDDAQKNLKGIFDKNLISIVNLSYTYYLQNNFIEARHYLNKIIRKKVGKNHDHEARFIHLAINHPKLPIINRIAENVSLYNIALWNMALIDTQHHLDYSIVSSHLKKVELQKDEFLVNKRVLYWIEYYRGNIKGALEKANNLLNECKKNTYIYDDVAKDINIFSEEIQTTQLDNCKG